MPRVFALIVAALVLLVAACGGSEEPEDPVSNVPSENGIREAVQSAASPVATDFPTGDGKTLQQLADTMTAGPDLALASSVFTTGGDSRMAFGMINKDGTPVYGVATDMENAPPQRIAAQRFAFALQFSDVALLPGRYHVRAHALDPEGVRLFDHVEHAFRMHGVGRV